jgi:hypothetical protein
MNYETLHEQTNAILKGAAYINRLLVEEERGRNAGGKRNVEASLIVATNESANPTEQNDVKREAQENLLENYALKNKLWFTAASFNVDDLIGEGAESKVYPSPNKGYVRKVINYRRYSNTPMDFLDNRISLHNYLFPDTAYILAGFTNTEDFTGKKQFAFVVEQTFIQGRYLNSYEHQYFKDEMRGEGWNYELENFKPLLFSKDYVVRDLHPENVLLTNKNSYSFIDPVPSLNTADSGYNGTRIYGNGEVIYIFHAGE